MDRSAKAHLAQLAQDAAKATAAKAAALGKRKGPEIPAIEFQHVEGEKAGTPHHPRAKSGQPLSSQAHASPSRTKLLSSHALRAAVIPENSTDQSRPLRDQRCTLSPSFRATMRKPSCLTAKSQPGPIGGFSARTGWAGRMNPGGARRVGLVQRAGERISMGAF